MPESLTAAGLAPLVSLILGLPLHGDQGAFSLPMVEFTRSGSTIGEIASFDAKQNRIVLPRWCASDPDERCRGVLVHELAHWLLVQHEVYPETTDPMSRFDEEMAARYAEECALLRRGEAPEYQRLRSAIRQGWMPPRLPQAEPCGE